MCTHRQIEHRYIFGRRNDELVDLLAHFLHLHHHQLTRYVSVPCSSRLQGWALLLPPCASLLEQVRHTHFHHHDYVHIHTYDHPEPTLLGQLMTLCFGTGRLGRVKSWSVEINLLAIHPAHLLEFHLLVVSPTAKQSQLNHVSFSSMSE